ncbi:hypothetical protein [Rickettsia endosymbiont of Halotydeus destructor]|uniref:hypothetical protein n=1 Tax=Rickettsia endosymbiont of Halotydeus destructor TaxID=2996754 RepID=UPI003BB1945B
MQYLQCAMLLGNENAFAKVAKFYNDDPINIRLQDTGIVIDKAYKTIVEHIQYNDSLLNSYINIINNIKLEWIKTPIPDFLIKSSLQSILEEYNKECQKNKVQCHLIADESDMRSHRELNDFTLIELQEIPKVQLEDILQESNTHNEEDNTSQLVAKTPNYSDSCNYCIII